MRHVKDRIRASRARPVSGFNRSWTLRRMLRSKRRLRERGRCEAGCSRLQCASPSAFIAPTVPWQGDGRSGWRVGGAFGRGVPHGPQHQPQRAGLLSPPRCRGPAHWMLQSPVAAQLRSHDVPRVLSRDHPRVRVSRSTGSARARARATPQRSSPADAAVHGGCHRRAGCIACTYNRAIVCSGVTLQDRQQQGSQWRRRPSQHCYARKRRRRRRRRISASAGAGPGHTSSPRSRGVRG